MAIPKAPPPTIQLVAIFSRHAEAIEWGRNKVVESWGRIRLTSPNFDHAETKYYEATMGQGLKKQFFILESSYDPAELAKSKLESNAWEQDLARSADYPESRPINIDPGYLTSMKLVLASAKDRAHRIYMGQGIYAEECLFFLDGQWQPRPWTYPDYQRSDVRAFFKEARNYLLQSQSMSEGNGVAPC
jgi:hypothetical protein